MNFALFGRFFLEFAMMYPAEYLCLITHDNSIAVQAQRIIRLEDGHVVYDGDAHAPEAVVQPNYAPKAEQEGSAS